MLLFKDAMKEAPIVAILRGVRPDEAIDVAGALVRAGVRIIEVTLNSPSPLPSIEKLKEAFDAEAVIGAGTVLREEEVDAVQSVGGGLIVSPNTDLAVIRRTKTLGMLSLPGFFTPSEAFAALDAGADALKLFPAEIASPKVVKAMRAVLPGSTRLLVVGGVHAGNMDDYIAAGADGFGIGSSLYKPGKPLAEIESDARYILDAARQAVGKAGRDE